jgi:hypothetical protein
MLKNIVRLNLIVFIVVFLSSYLAFDLRKHKLDETEQLSVSELQSAIQMEAQISKQARELMIVYLFGLLFFSLVNTICLRGIARKKREDA